MLIETEVWGRDLIETHVWATGAGGIYAVVDTLPSALNGDFTLIGWYKDVQESDLPMRLWDIGAFQLELSGSVGSITVEVADSNGSDSAIVDWGLSSWANFIVIRSGTTITVKYNGEDVIEYVSSPLEDYGTTVQAITDTCYVFDLKVLPRAITDDDVTYYRDNILNHGGDAVLPNF